MCDPVTLGIAVATGIGSKIISGNEATSAAKRDAAARNAVLAATMAKEKGFAADNAGQLEGNIAHYAPGVQQTQLADAQTARANNSTGNMTMSDPNGVPVTADAPPAVKSEIAKRMLAAHDGAVERAGLNAKVGGFGDTWLKNNLNTAETDRNIGVTNNYANGTKSILGAQQDAASAAAYKPPSIWGPVLSGASSIAAGAAGGGGFKGGFTMPNIPGFNPISGVAG
jgi:hypothetical protein